MALPRVVIVGGGFGGLYAAKGLGGARVEVTVVDRHNYHLFQPLLYQVAISTLSPSDIASPIRGLLRRQRNATVALLEVTGVDLANRRVQVAAEGDEEQSFPYDHLVLATGVEKSYFGHDEFAAVAPGLKSLADATAVRTRVLKAFERAEVEIDPSRHRDLLTFVLVGAGPTGVEMAGALIDLTRMTLKSDFRRIDPTSARIVLVEGGPRVLPSFAEELSQKAADRLRRGGVEIRTGKQVELVDAQGVVVGGERIRSRTVIWTAGVTPSPAGKWLGVPTDRAGRVLVGPDLSAPGLPDVFVVGDTAHLEQDGKPLPGVAQVALQQGRYAGELIASRVAGRSAPAPFRYFDKGNLAVIGRNFAILESGRVHMAGFLAWCVWAGIHLGFLPATESRLVVLRKWSWMYLTKQLSSRLIVGRGAPEPETPQAKSASIAS
jgi:NADH:ubiquinone reductase (H+-translocating)